MTLETLVQITIGLEIVIILLLLRNGTKLDRLMNDGDIELRAIEHLSKRIKY